MIPKDSVALYARVSSESQARDNTIASQVTALRERIAADGFQLEPDHNYVDEGYSGAILFRPALERLRDAIAGGQVERVYVHAPDRLARRYAHQVLLIDEFRRAGTEVVFLNHPIGGTAEDDLLLQVQGVIAEYNSGCPSCRSGIKQLSTQLKPNATSPSWSAAWKTSLPRWQPGSIISTGSACRISFAPSYAGSKSATVVSRSYSGSHHQMVQRDQDRRPKRPALGNIVQALVERTFAWISRNRRLARDFERYATTVTSFIRLAMIRIMLRRLAPANASS